MITDATTRKLFCHHTGDRIFKAAKKAGVEAHQVRRAEAVEVLSRIGDLSDAAESEPT
jgi:hypothetical protein